MKSLINKTVQLLPPKPHPFDMLWPSSGRGQSDRAAKWTCVHMTMQNSAADLHGSHTYACWHHQPNQLPILREKLKESKLNCTQVQRVLPAVSAETKIHLALKCSVLLVDHLILMGTEWKSLEKSLSQGSGESPKTHKPSWFLSAHVQKNQKAHQNQQHSL